MVGSRGEKKRMAHKKKWELFLVDLLILTVIFIALYHRYLFGGELYAYTDVGADTIDQYLPMTVFEVDSLREGMSETYSLQYGLGKYNGGYLLKYLNPVNLPLLLCGGEQINGALMVSMYLKYVIICLFALLFFLHLLENDQAASVCSLLWTFSGYAVLWGQHYQFLTALAAFTVAVWGFQLFLDEDKRWYLVIPTTAYLAYNSYYHLYIGCFFFLAYGVLYLHFRGRTLLQILKKSGAFALVMIIAVCMAAATLVPSLENFLESSRVSQVTSGAGSDSWIYQKNVLMAMLSRLLSNDLFGVGNEFLGPTNYYECAILSVSVLFVFSFVYLLQGKHRTPMLLIAGSSVLLLCSPKFSQIIVFSESAQRWTYLLCFAQVIAIGIALSDLFRRQKEPEMRKRLVRTLIGTDILLALMFVVLYRYHIQVGGWLLNEKALVVLGIILAVYHIGLLVMTKSRCSFAVLLVLVAAELVLANYASINDRETVSVEQWESGLYNDGTAEVVQWLRQQDDSLYRIAKTYWSVHYCDSLVQDYNGMGIYSSTNSAELLELAESLGYSWAGNRVGFDGTDLLANSLLGVKYIIAESGSDLNPDYYEMIYDDGIHEAYLNRYWMGFGWWSDEEFPLEGDTTLERLSESEVKTVDLMTYLTQTEQCQIDGTGTVTGTGPGMILSFDVPELEEGWLVSGIRIKLTAQMGSSLYLLTATENETFSWNHYDVVSYDSGSGIYCLDNTYLEPLTGIQLKVSLVSQELSIEALELIVVDGEKLREELAERQNSCVTDMTQQGSTFTVRLTNPGEESATLCLPLVYSNHWEATVDGKTVEVRNVNSGLTGLEIEPGEHELRLTYRDPVYYGALVLSITCAAAYVFAVYRNVHKKDRMIKND